MNFRGETDFLREAFAECAGVYVSSIPYDLIHGFGCRFTSLPNRNAVKNVSVKQYGD